MEVYSEAAFDRYLECIGVRRTAPSWEALAELTSAHLRRVPFENVSKIYRAHFLGIRKIPRLDEFLDGIERCNFGGTCYTNNYYMHLLLVHLGYRARLCSADIAVNGAPPDGHMVNVVSFGAKEAIVDVGYGEPFWKPIPRNKADDIVLELGSERYVLKPQDQQGRSRLEVYRSNQLAHGYLLKPASKTIHDFAEVVDRSYEDKAPFLNRLVVTRFFEDWALVLRNHTLTEIRPSAPVRRQMETLDAVVETIVDRFGMPEGIACAAVGLVGSKIFGS
ncbi:MAG TPA: arylamine N-acetyltransferase [candidate division Zixibacteria bacterium]|nr:arylamine N-acetyltransferase [candidate division Zixibacteria bacterium]MDD4917498.1 arylamine N-acetyltransferase [candidate division Zixibacteria bacterium]HPM36572.1 arylamine N-acetyltransferase [candidate division Zixibacteria bacterium]